MRVGEDFHLGGLATLRIDAGEARKHTSCAMSSAVEATFRTERQTFIPLPQQRQAVFTIGVESRPLTLAIDSPKRARRLHDALASMTPAVLAYRGLTDARARLLAWLAARAE